MPDEPDLQHPRVALSTVLLITTAAACVAAMWEDRHTKARLRLDRDLLRRELQLPDWRPDEWPGSGLQATPVGVLHPRRYFRYRVSTPEGGRAVARLIVTRTDASGVTLQREFAMLRLRAGESPLDVFIYREAAGHQWRYRLTSRVANECVGPLPPWFDEDGADADVRPELYPTSLAGLAAGRRKVLMDCSNLRDDATTTRVKLTIEWEQQAP